MGARVTLRPVAAADAELIARIYAWTRAEEMAVVPWSEEEKGAFLAQQHAAQRAHYEAHYPYASHDVIEVDGEPAGRLYVDRRPADIRIVDIALLPEHRGRGVGGELIGRLLDEARERGASVSIHVEHGNPARRLYERLGFEPVEERGIHVLLTWRAETPA